MRQAFHQKAYNSGDSTLDQFFYSQTSIDEMQIALFIIFYETLGKYLKFL